MEQHVTVLCFCSLRQLLVCASEYRETVYQTQVWTVTMWVVVPTKLRDRLLSKDCDDWKVRITLPSQKVIIMIAMRQLRHVVKNED